MHLWRVGLHCLQDIDQWWQWLPLDLHQFKGILGNIATFGGNRNYRFTGISYLLYSNCVLDDRLCTEGRHRTNHFCRIAPSQDRVYAWQLFGSACIDANNASMSIGTAQHGCMKHTRQLYIVGILRPTCEQSRI